MAEEGWTGYAPDAGAIAWNAAEAGEYDKAQTYGLFYLARQVRDLRQSLDELAITVQDVGHHHVHHGVVLFQPAKRDGAEVWRATFRTDNETSMHEGPDKEEVVAWAIGRPAELWMYLDDDGEWVVWYHDEADAPQP